MRKTLLALICIIYSLPVFTQQDSLYHSKMKWFEEAKLGIFIHWGIYAVNGISESWSFYNGYISHEDYLKQCEGFGAENYDPDYWADLIEESGAKYAVITSRHHDGFSLWKSKDSELNVVEHSSAKKDVLSPFIEALEKRNIKKGIYYSLPDWSHQNYTHHTKKKMRYNISDDKKRWKKFQSYYFSQLRDLKKKFDPDLWWFDGDWEHSADEWDVFRIKDELSQKRNDVIFNSRLVNHGDYATPEIGLPVYKPKSEYWELCMTMNDSWGYQHNDKKYKSPQQVIDIFVDCIAKGGNLLLDIGPKADGSIPVEQIDILKKLGRWTNKHQEAIYGSKSGIPYEHFYGPSALSRDSSILYLYIRDVPKDGKVIIKGISNEINRIFVVGEGTLLEHEKFCHVFWSKYPGIVYIDLPESVIDENYTVIAIMLEGKIDLYSD